ncbi:GNAT family N-acetyltransferase [Psychrobacillus sp. FJAT-51614]|uniref:GNAT family N-acetyltransferase n=1 Tax=Psychrobacillus mangrovi TaxID=3117745 RepID=A0ABU8F784_9BACI
MKLSIEIANLSDLNEINAIVKAGHDDHAEALPHIFKKVEAVMPESYYKELLMDANCAVLIAKEKEEIIGFAVMELHVSPSFESMVQRKFAYMNDLGIKRNSQRKGIGKALFEACVEWSKNKGATSLDLNVWEFNQTAISFYENFEMKNLSRKMTLPL